MKYLFFIFVVCIFSNPIQFQKKQISYKIFEDRNKINEIVLEDFDNFFTNIYNEIYENWEIKKSNFFQIQIYTNFQLWKKKFPELKFSRAGYNSEQDEFYFYFASLDDWKNSKQTIQHEICHSALAKLKPEGEKINFIIEEGFCNFQFPTGKLNFNYDKSILKLSYSDLLKKISSSTKKKEIQEYLNFSTKLFFNLKVKNIQFIKKIHLKEIDFEKIFEEFKRKEFNAK